jgi:predicted secreted acid phosphatase
MVIRFRAKKVFLWQKVKKAKTIRNNSIHKTFKITFTFISHHNEKHKENKIKIKIKNL